MVIVGSSKLAPATTRAAETLRWPAPSAKTPRLAGSADAEQEGNGEKPQNEEQVCSDGEAAEDAEHRPELQYDERQQKDAEAQVRAVSDHGEKPRDPRRAELRQGETDGERDQHQYDEGAGDLAGVGLQTRDDQRHDQRQEQDGRHHQEHHQCHRIGEIAARSLGQLGEEGSARRPAEQQKPRGMGRVEGHDPGERPGQQRRDDEIDPQRCQRRAPVLQGRENIAQALAHPHRQHAAGNEDHDAGAGDGKEQIHGDAPVQTSAFSRSGESGTRIARDSMPPERTRAL